MVFDTSVTTRVCPSSLRRNLIPAEQFCFTVLHADTLCHNTIESYSWRLTSVYFFDQFLQTYAFCLQIQRQSEEYNILEHCLHFRCVLGLSFLLFLMFWNHDELAERISPSGKILSSPEVEYKRKNSLQRQTQLLEPPCILHLPRASYIYTVYISDIHTHRSKVKHTAHAQMYCRTNSSAQTVSGCRTNSHFDTKMFLRPAPLNSFAPTIIINRRAI